MKPLLMFAGYAARKVVFPLSLFLFYSASSGDSSHVQDGIVKFFEFQKQLAQEKVYLHTDKPVYGSGETIFLKGYLVDAVTHSPLVETNFIYVELLNRMDSVLVRKKFKRLDGSFVGGIDIPLLAPPGDYYLRSYTEWMRNAPADYFFTKRLQIGNAVITDINPEVDYIANEDGQQVMKIGFFNDSHKPYSDEKVQYTLTDKTGKVYRSRSTKTNTNGIAYITLDERSMPADDPRVDIELDNKKYDYKRSFYVNPQAEDYAVTFLPEGGRLLAGVPQIVAFKAQNERGFGETVTGYVLNTANDTVAEINTDHDGMGKFLLTAAQDNAYRAIVRSATGTYKEIILPKPETTRYALALSQNSGKAFYKILSALNNPISDTLYLFAHTRGQLVFTAEVPPDKPAGAISAELFPDGITHFVLCDKTGIPQSERLAFFMKPQMIRCTITPDKPKYNAREKATLNITLKDADGNPVQGDFSVSITDSNSVRQDTTADNIVSKLLLTSDLKGYIDCPQYYFGDSPSVVPHRDLLMLTHGWTRFRIDNLNELPEPEINYFKEAGQFITGHIENLIGGNAKRAVVIGSWRDERDSVLKFANTTADDNGNFVLENISFRDTATFMVQGRTKGHSDRVTVSVDSTDYPKMTGNPYFKDNYKLLTDNYIEQVREDYYNKGGVPVLSVKEIVVSAKKLINEAISIEAIMYDNNDLKKDGVHSVFDALKSMKGIVWQPKNLYEIKKSIQKEPIYDVFLYQLKPICTYIVDEFIVPIEFLHNIDVNCVESLEIIPEPRLAFFRAFPRREVLDLPAVNIRIKKDGFRQLLAVSPGLTIFRKLGYSDAKEFYCPVYDTPQTRHDAKPDLRTTIYWNPAVRIGISGNIAFDYYTSDFPEMNRIVIEGITTKGNPVYYSSVLQE